MSGWQVLSRIWRNTSTGAAFRAFMLCKARQI